MKLIKSFFQSNNKKQEMSPKILRQSQLLSPLPLIDNFIGFNCRSYAIAGITKWLYQSGRISHQPYPARKLDFMDYHELSLREIAKKKYHSATGEVYNINDLAALAEENQEIKATSLSFSDENAYIGGVVSAIDANKAPIVFFDVDTYSENHFGMLTKMNGNHEHAAVVVGYCIYANQEVNFILGQWGNYYECPAKDLFESSIQLLKTRSGEDIYCKIRNQKLQSCWVTSEFIQELDSKSFPIEAKRQATSPTTDGGYAGKILVLSEKKELELQQKPQF